MDWSKNRVLVTGASGIVGSWLVGELLRRGSHVVCLVRDSDPQSQLFRSNDIARTTVVNGSLEEYQTIERAINEHETDTVFHLGAQTIVETALRSPLPTFEANIRGSYNLLEACRVRSDIVKRIVVASSDKAYGESEVLPYTEEMPLKGSHPYDVSKSCTDLIAMTYSNTYHLPVTVARCGNIYGGGDLNWSRIVPGTIRSVLEGQRPVLRSDGRNLRDYVYVKDIVNAYLALGECAQENGVCGEAFNFSCESPVSVLDITASILRLMERADIEPVILNRATGEIRDQFLDASKARQRLQWVPRYTLEDGLGETIAWYREFLRA
ncbi:MAG: GDP-mannose 4,6-dehydratase [Symbiobacteriia bacterium]